jgi:hypothetical protein
MTLEGRARAVWPNMTRCQDDPCGRPLLRPVWRRAEPSKHGPAQGARPHRPFTTEPAPPVTLVQLPQIGASGRLTRSRNLFGVFVVRGGAKMGIEQLALQQE